MRVVRKVTIERALDTEHFVITINGLDYDQHKNIMYEVQNIQIEFGKNLLLKTLKKIIWNSYV